MVCCASLPCPHTGSAGTCRATVNNILETKGSQLLWLRWWLPGPILMSLIGFLPRWLSHWLHSQIRSISHLQLFSCVLWRTSNADRYKSLCNVGRSLAVSCNLPRHSLQEGISRLDFLETASELSFLWKLEPSWHGLSIMVFKRRWKMHLHGPSHPWDFP